MIPLLACIVITFLEVIDLSKLNCFLVYGHLNNLEGCTLVLWLKYFFAVVIIQFLFSVYSRTVAIFLPENFNTIIKQQLRWKE